jgi:hypothetical protein
MAKLNPPFVGRRNLSEALGRWPALRRGWFFLLALSVATLGVFTIGRVVALGSDSWAGSWAIGDLLTNYEGGFVRRGLFGQVLLATSAPAASAFSVQVAVASLFIGGCLILLFLRKDIASATSAFTLIMFAPGGLFDMSSDLDFGYLGRKEIWFYVVLIFLVLHGRRFGLLRLGTVILFSLVSVVMILHHELFFVFFSIPIAGLFIVLALGEAKRKALLLPAAYIFFNAATFLVVILNPGDDLVVEGILGSLQNTDASEVRGGITAIGWNFEESHGLSIKMLSEGSILYWLFFLLLTAILIVNSIVTSSKSYLSALSSLAVASWLFIAAGGAAFSGWDWGRWISMLGVGFFTLESLIQVVETQYVGQRKGSVLDRLHSRTIQRASASAAVLSLLILCFAALAAALTDLEGCCPASVDEIWGPRLPAFLSRLAAGLSGLFLELT